MTICWGLFLTVWSKSVTLSSDRMPLGMLSQSPASVRGHRSSTNYHQMQALLEYSVVITKHSKTENLWRNEAEMVAGAQSNAKRL